MALSTPLTSVIELVAPPFCWACGGDARRSEPLCADCRAELTWLAAEPWSTAGGLDAWAPLAYAGPARALVAGLKFRGAPALATPMAAQIVARAPAGLLRPPAELVPVPLHPARARRRGFNQAERLAAAIGSRAGMTVSDCLRRGGGTAGPQVGKGRAERLDGLRGSVELRPGAASPAHAVLVDDVVTTGATLAACGVALRAGGSREVAAVVYARTPGR